MELALQADRPGKHPVKAVIVGGDVPGVLLKGGPLQQVLQAQAEGDLDHHARGADPLAQVDDRLDSRGNIARLVRRDGDPGVRHLRRAGIEGDPLDVGDPELLQLGDGLPGHGLGHVDKQHTASRGQFLEPAELPPAEGHLYRHGLAVDGDVPQQLLRRAVGVGGGHKQVRPVQHPGGAAVQHGEDGDVRRVREQPGDVGPVGLRRSGVQGDDGDLLFSHHNRSSFNQFL